MKATPRALPLLVIAFLAILFLAPVLFTDRVLLPGEFLQQLKPFSAILPASEHRPNWNPLQWDALAEYYPWRLFAQRELRQNRIPLWNPHEFCGAPFIANGQSAVFYPLNILFWILPTAVAFEWSAALHVFLAGAFMYGLGRTLRLSVTASLLAGISFMFSGFIVTWLELPTLVNVAVWIPLVFLLIEKIIQQPRMRYFLLLAVTLGLQLLAGHFQISLYLLLAVALRWLWELGRQVIASMGRAQPMNSRPLLLVGVALVLGCSLAAIQVLPTAEFAMYSHRSGAPTHEGYQWYVANAMPWEHLGTLFIPDLFGNPTKSTYWGPGSRTGGPGSYTEMCGYIGFLPIVFALLAFAYLRRARMGFYGFLMVFALLVALGTPLTCPLYFWIPGFSQAGGFSRVLVLFCFSASLLAGVGWQFCFGESPGQRRSKLASVAIIGAVGWSFARFGAHPFGDLAISPPLPPADTLMIGVGWLALAIAFVCGKLSSKAFSAFSIMVIAGHALSFACGFNPSSPRSYVYPQIKYTDNMETRSRTVSISGPWSLSPDRFPDATLPPNGMMVYNGYDIQGYDSLQSKYYKDLAARLEGGNPTPPENGNMLLLHNVSSPWLDVLGVKYVFSAYPLHFVGAKLIRDDPMFCYENQDAYPPAFAVDHLPSDAEARTGIPFRPATVTSYSSLHVSIHSEVSGRYLILTDSFVPGWRVYVNGHQAHPLRWAGALRAVQLEDSSPCDVNWIYLPISHKLGAILSLLTGSLLSGFVGGCMMRSRHTQDNY